MQKLYDVLLPKKNSKGEYVKNKNGKSVYDNWGFIAENDKGYKKLCVKSMTGDVWFDLFEVKENQQPAEPTGDIDDGIPF